VVLDEHSQDEFLNVAAGLAVLAGIAASDAICWVRLRSRHRGDAHRKAADLLKTAVPDRAQLSSSLARLLDVKDEAHYGVIVVAPRKPRDTVRWASSLVSRAADEVERRWELAYADLMSLYLSGDEAADQLLSTDPLALVIGMVLDQQVRKPWSAR
jgi:hypothetical protein